MRWRLFAGLFVTTSLSACQQHDEAPSQVAPASTTGGVQPGTSSPTTGPGDASGGETSSSSSDSSSEGTASSAEGTSDSPSTSEASSTGAPEGCGDGVVDLWEEEECDEGYTNNSDGGHCTQNCKLARCGDGLLHVGVEQCDDGPMNNDLLYAGCNQACELNGFCGDGALDPEEECDASAPTVEGMAPCEPNTCHLAARLMFVTSMSFAGDFGGLDAGDALCNAAAASAGLDNPAGFRAWLSGGGNSPLTRFEHAPDDDGYPYAGRDGQLLAHDWDALLAWGPKRPIDVTELGTQLPAGSRVWTATNSMGTLIKQELTCLGWSSKSLQDSAQVGLVSPVDYMDLPMWKSAGYWTSFASVQCKKSYHLYCLED